jgi:hypothetical protein
MRSVIFMIPALAARVAAAEPPSDPPAPPAVPPNQVSGVTVDDDNSSTVRDVGRVMLYPIRLGTEVAVAPLRGGAWLVERYQLRDRIAHWLLSDDGTSSTRRCSSRRVSASTPARTCSTTIYSATAST